VWAVFFTALATLLLVVLFVFAAGVWLPFLEKRTDREYWIAAAASGFAVGLGTLFRPETPLLLAIAFLPLTFILLRQRQPQRLLLSIVLMLFAAALPLVPWTIRNAITLREFQPLAPRNTMLPGELDPQGFMAWERTWLYRVRDCYLVPWKLN